MPCVDVVLGSFPHGLPRFGDRSNGSAPQWVRDAIAGGPRPQVPRQAKIAPAAPPAQLKSAVQIPPHLATFARNGGQPLPTPLQARMRDVFGANFADVRVHVGREASALGAQAFAHGNNVYFAPGQYQPNTHQGMRLIAHELTHIVQMRAGRVRNPFGSGIAVVHDRMLEAEAERFGLRIAVMQPLIHPARGFSVRKPAALHGLARGTGSVIQGAFTVTWRQDETWVLNGRPGFRAFVLRRLVERYNESADDDDELDLADLSLTDEELDQCHITPWATIRDGIVEAYLNGGMSRNEFIRRTTALYSSDNETDADRAEWLAMDTARTAVIAEPDEENVRELAILLNSATPNLRLDNNRINRRIRDRPDPPLDWTPLGQHLRVDTPARENLEENIDIMRSPRWTPGREHFLSSSMDDPVSPGRLTPRTRDAMDI